MANQAQLPTPEEESPFVSYRKIMREHLRAHTEGTNINPNTLLTTDYLNHFTAILMLLQIFPSAPEDFAEDVFSWQPISYEEHFESTGFRNKELAILAYHHAPPDVLAAFDQTIAELHRITCDILKAVRKAMDSGEVSNISNLIDERCEKLQALIDHAAAIANGHEAMLESPMTNSQTDEDDSPSAHQAAIDVIFD